MLRRNIASAIFMCNGVANCVYIGVLPGLMGMANGTVLSNAYIFGSIASPARPWIWLCRHTSCISAVFMCLQSALIFAGSRRGANVGGFLRNPAASSNVMS